MKTEDDSPWAGSHEDDALILLFFFYLLLQIFPCIVIWTKSLCRLVADSHVKTLIWLRESKGSRIMRTKVGLGVHITIFSKIYNLLFLIPFLFPFLFCPLFPFLYCGLGALAWAPIEERGGSLVVGVESSLVTLHRSFMCSWTGEGGHSTREKQRYRVLGT